MVLRAGCSVKSFEVELEDAMSVYTMTIPDGLYEKAKRVAQQTSRPVDEILTAWLEVASAEPTIDLPVDERAELKAMMYLADDTLWMIAREQLPVAIQARMSALLSKNTHGTISESEYADLTDLVERGNQLTLRKAQAMKYLTDRGFSIRLDDLKPDADE